MKFDELIRRFLEKKCGQPKARKSPEGFMGSASREHKVKKGKGSFTRKPKHKNKGFE